MLSFKMYSIIFKMQVRIQNVRGCLPIGGKVRIANIFSIAVSMDCLFHPN